MKKFFALKFIFIGIMSIILGITLLGDSIFGQKMAKNKLDEFKSKSTKTIAVVDKNYKVSSTSARDYYHSKYEFVINGKNYSGHYNFDSPSKMKNTLIVHYMPNDPSQYYISIDDEIAKIESNIESKTGYIFGPAAILLGLIPFFLGYKILDSNSKIN